MDRTYHEKMVLRRQLVEEHEKDVIAVNPVAEDAVLELYRFLFGTYLPKRFPFMFSVETGEKGRKQARNLILGDIIPLEPIPRPRECLRTIACNVDGEFNILLPTANPTAEPCRIVPSTEPKEVYHLHAFALVFPSGFNTPKKLGLPLSGRCYAILNPN
jgi:hypothetical protein